MDGIYFRAKLAKLSFRGHCLQAIFNNIKTSTLHCNAWVLVIMTIPGIMLMIQVMALFNFKLNFRRCRVAGQSIPIYMMVRLGATELCAAARPMHLYMVTLLI